MIKKILTLLGLITGSFCHAQQMDAADTTTIKLKEIQPLYVVDGKIVDKATIDTMNPATIERIDVLKNESATERYGEMGKNGAVIITSKGQEKQGFKRSKQRRS